MNASFHEQEVSLPAAFPLAATLALPADASSDSKVPVVVMVHGSGDLDRDENSKRLRINAFKELSDPIASLGFATLRYDKRGVGRSGGSFLEAGFFDLVDDAEAAVRYAKSRAELDPERVVLLGHSEGSMIAPAVHVRVPVQGMILLAPTAEPLPDTTAWQREQMYEELRGMKGFSGWLVRLLKVENKIAKMNDEMIAAIRGSDAPVVKYKGKKINAKWQRDHERYDVRVLLREIACPVLAIVGDKDVQVKKDDVYGLRDLVQGPCETLVIEDMTHLLRKTDKDLRFSVILKDYKNQVKRPIEPELTAAVSRWLNAWKSEAR
ncbi:alpha/beta fold hydrolase [Paenibacillus sp.]|uniref:alpha/beta hydrolase n=1 Tax=Paenibacillus sp. TaxID=58172 RepID=UPI002811204D|nr:alpha/beta fold hydrolase [Paenibacillus sp.]